SATKTKSASSVETSAATMLRPIWCISQFCHPAGSVESATRSLIQRCSSSRFASDSVHGIACALSCVRGGLNEFDTYLVELATPNWSWSYAGARFDVEQGSLSV